MDRVLHCHCGFEVRGYDEDALVAEVRRHACEAHGMALSFEDALLVAFHAELSHPDGDADALRSDPDPRPRET